MFKLFLTTPLCSSDLNIDDISFAAPIAALLLSSTVAFTYYTFWTLITVSLLLLLHFMTD